MSSGMQADFVTATLEPLGFEQITANFGAAQNLPNIPDNAEVALIQVDGGGIRWRDDGTAPTTGAGLFLSGSSADLTAPHEVLQYNGRLAEFQLIEDANAGAPTAVNVSYYRYV